MPTQSVGDFGSGSGFYSLALAKMVGDSGRVYAIDIQKDLLAKIKNEAAKSHLFNIEIIWADFEAPLGTRLKENTLDRAIISNTLFQIENKEDFLSEVARVLRPSGKVMVVEWADSFGGLGPEKNKILPKEKCLKLLQKAGFVLEKEIKAGAHHYGFVMKKA